MFRNHKFQKLLHKYSDKPLVVAQIGILGKRGLGVLATEDIPLQKKHKTRGLGIYWGELTLESTNNSAYVFAVSQYEVDAHKFGNWTRFVNHSKGNFNVVANQKSFVLGKQRFPYIEYALIKPVKAGQQLLIDYGPEYEFDKAHQIYLNPSNNSMHDGEIYAHYHADYIPLKGKFLSACRNRHLCCKIICAKGNDASIESW